MGAVEHWTWGTDCSSAAGNVKVCRDRAPWPALGHLWVLGRGALMMGAVPAALQARRVSGQSLTLFSSDTA